MEFEWPGGKLEAQLDWGQYSSRTIVRFRTPGDFKMNTAEARDMIYALLDYLRDAPFADEPIDRCDSCKEHGTEFTLFINAQGARGMICDDCAHRIYEVRARKAWKEKGRPSG